MQKYLFVSSQYISVSYTHLVKGSKQQESKILQALEMTILRRVKRCILNHIKNEDIREEPAEVYQVLQVRGFGTGLLLIHIKI